MPTSDVRIRPGEPAGGPFLVEMAQLAAVIEDHPLPVADDPELLRALPASPDESVVALDRAGRPIGAAWWHIRNPAARLYSRAGFVDAEKGRGPLGVAMVREVGTA